MTTLPLNLINNSQYYDWFAALLLCESSYLDKKRIGDIAKPNEEYIRLGQKPTLIFPAQAIYGLNRQTNPPWLMQYFFGVFGSNGALPLHLTEYAIEQERYNKDIVFTRFVNIFHHRSLSLFYRGWRLAQPTADFFPDDNLSFAKKIESLVGVAELKKVYFGADDVDKKYVKSLKVLSNGEENFEQRLSVFYKSYVFRLAKASKNVESLKLLLENFIHAPVEIKTNHIEYLSKQNNYCSLLGKNESTLGNGMQLGSKVLSAQSSIIIVVGPIDLDDYNKLLLSSYKNILIDIIKKIIGLTISIKIEFKVKRSLSLTFKSGLVLGHNCWLGASNKVSKAATLKC